MKKKSKKIMPLHHVVGWAGAITLIGAFFLVSYGVIKTDQLIYQVLNIFAAAALFYLGYKKDVKESMFLNGFWFVIALSSIIRYLIS